MSTDQIRKQIILRATRERVWQAISDHTAFGTWFGVEIDGPFIAGQEAVGRIVPTKVDPAVARLQEPYRGAAFRIMIERIEPMRLFSFRWHPFAIDQAQSYENEPMTLVSFALEDVEGGVRLTITESGFDQLPVARRDSAWKANDGGWAHQTRLIERYVTTLDVTALDVTTRAP
jgi:uncharacterized protein YndB with AHSA1/START domain